MEDCFIKQVKAFILLMSICVFKLLTQNVIGKSFLFFYFPEISDIYDSSLCCRQKLNVNNDVEICSQAPEN